MKRWHWTLLSVPLAVSLLTAFLWPSASIQASRDRISLTVHTNVSYDGIEAVDPGIVYPPDADTDKEKLAAIYNLIEQMRLEHNRQGKWANEDWKARAVKWYEYVEIFKRKMYTIFTEKNTIEDKLRKERYDDEYWESLKQAAKDTAYIIMYGDRTILKEITTLATCDVLDQLKAVDIAKLEGQYVDPYEDFTDWTETDTGPGGSCTVTTTSITVANNGVESEVKVVGDYGSGHFSGDFEHFVDSKITASGGNYEYAGIYAATNTNGYWDTMTAGIQVYSYIAGERYYLDNPAGSGTYMSCTLNTQYYLAIDRTNTTGTLYCYTDSNRTTLHDDISITVANTAWQYLVCGYTHSNGHYSNVNWIVSNLDIQEAAAEPSMVAAPSSKAFGVITQSATHWSKGSEPSWPLDDAEAYFYVYNDGSVSIDVTASATNAAGGTGLTLVSGSPEAEEFRISLFAEGDGSSDNLTLGTTQQSWLSSLAASSNTSWEVKLETGITTETPPTGKTFHIYLIASAS